MKKIKIIAAVVLAAAALFCLLSVGITASAADIKSISDTSVSCSYHLLDNSNTDLQPEFVQNFMITLSKITGGSSWLMVSSTPLSLHYALW